MKRIKAFIHSTSIEILMQACDITVVKYVLRRFDALCIVYCILCTVHCVLSIVSLVFMMIIPSESGTNTLYFGRTFFARCKAVAFLPY